MGLTKVHYLLLLLLALVLATALVTPNLTERMSINYRDFMLVKGLFFMLGFALGNSGSAEERGGHGG